jgi:hypothetical protein
MKAQGSRSRKGGLAFTRGNLRDLPDELRKDIRLTLQQYTVPLLGLQLGNGGEIAEFLGSGTLVTVRNAYYILTAAHVWCKLRHFSGVATSLTSYRSLFVVETCHIVPTVIGTWTSEEWGPDIVLLRLPLVAVSRIRAHKVFYNVEKYLAVPARHRPSLR